ncbi:uncharacterized protein [Nicotiana tomentosiformis]|uniref:uncharacterized protein n=1 Tax=Nicotiana tomentosiformis TaxID=4098 RepID=UPI00388C871B
MPLAYGVVHSKNDVAWSWFFEKFKEAYGERENMCIISDRNESIYIESVVPSTEHLHMVNDEGRHYTVCLLEKECSCGRFQVDELLCTRAWAVLKSKFLMLEDYCSDYYKPKSVIMTYEVPVYPLPDRNEWNIPVHISEKVVLPPK